MCENNNYTQHLFFYLARHYGTVIKQKGKTDIEPPNFVEIVLEWYDNLIKNIYEKEPEFYVKAINVYENGQFDINHIEYIYYLTGEKINGVSVNLFDATENDLK